MSTPRTPFYPMTHDDAERIAGALEIISRDSVAHTPQISIGTVTTVPAGSNATASITGDSDDLKLNLGIPRGASGDEVIDDTAGDGVTDRTWSTDKLTEEFSNLNLEKVDKEAGKGLSTNDYTNEEKLKNANNASAISDLNRAFDGNFGITYTESPGYISNTGSISAQSGTNLEVYTSYIPFVVGQTIDFKLVKSNESYGHWVAYATYDKDQTFIKRINISNNEISKSFEKTIETIDSNCRYIRITYRSYGSEAEIVFTNVENSVNKALIAAIKLDGGSEDVDILKIKTKNTLVPELRNGSDGNPSNAYSISTKYIFPIDFTKDSILVEYTGNASLADSYYFGYCLFNGATDGMTSSAAFDSSGITKKQYNNNANLQVYKPGFEVQTKELTGYDHIMFFLFRSLNGSQVPLRIATDQHSLRITWKINYGINDRDVDFSETKHDLLYAKHATGNAGTRLTILHFSDLHKDTGALARIMDDAKFFEYDDAICTGDMVDNTYEQISSWWDASVLTCIGNHDSASYSSGSGYNWTALSMANRSAYYIEPFESGWGITHTSGKSYYYKDYSDAKVRLIVMDAMLYTDNGQDATDQTTWLSGLLSSAITNNLHVLIAIHAPHGGATAEDCSFSRYGQTEMPTHTDCNTPQAVIDAVSSAITSGLHFIGYIVGHTHQDNVWDAEGDGKQLMYCITCASVSNVNQWKNSDQHRDTENDAYNIITIDTANSLVKILRGGGANIDDHMRTRKAICFNYSTGEKVGEVL